MDSQQAVIWMIVACIAFIGMLIFSKPLKLIVKVILRAVVGLCGVFLTNLILNPFGLTVGINLLTGFIIGLLGVPGFVTLYIARYFL